MSNEFHYQYVTINIERYFKSAASETKIKFRSFGRWTIILNLYQNWGYYKDFEISNILEDKTEEWFRNVNIIYVLSIELFLKDVGTLPSIITTTACANQQHVTKLVRCSHDLHRPLKLHLIDSMSPFQKVHLSYHPHINNSF